MTDKPSSATVSGQSVPLDESPSERMRLAIARYGQQTVAIRAANLLRGRNEGEEFLLWLGGRHAQGVLDGAPALYWPEVWGARALLSVWDDGATDAVLSGLGNRAWRVREMCVKVCGMRELDASDAVARCATDEVARVRSAVVRALGAIGRADRRPQLQAMLKDPDKEVRRAAQQSLAVLDSRLGDAAAE